jgi:hypothetical protein
MGRFQRSERGGGQPDPQEALRRARDAVARERAQRGEDHSTEEGDDQRRAADLEDVEDAMRERDGHQRDD